MPNHSTKNSNPPRVPPYKLLGVSGILYALYLGVCLGVLVAMTTTALAKSLVPTHLQKSIFVMCLIFGLLFGPLSAVAAASRLAAAGLTGKDFFAPGWIKLGLCSLLGLGLGLGSGFIVGTTLIQIIPVGDGIIFMFVVIGGIAGTLVATTLLIFRSASRPAKDVS